MTAMKKVATIASLAVFVGMLSIGVFGFEQPSKKGEQAETTHLIDSIQGPALYKAYCAVCHGTELKGDGPMANFVRARVPDLTQIETRNGGTFPLLRVRRVISGEEILPTGHGTRDMPVWGPIFSQVAWDMDLGRVRVDNLARYIQDKQVK
jgi:mono/diheme cytochrome c family protein